MQKNSPGLLEWESSLCHLLGQKGTNSDELCSKETNKTGGIFFNFLIGDCLLQCSNIGQTSQTEVLLHGDNTPLTDPLETFFYRVRTWKCSLTHMILPAWLLIYFKTEGFTVRKIFWYSRHCIFQCLKPIPEKDFLDAFDRRVKRWQRCVKVDGEVS